MKKVLEVIRACLEMGIREFILCAGARNIALIEALHQCENVYLWHHFEERSAGFFALGRSHDSAEPCAVITTSGTAVAELFPSVIEAYYQARPLIVISADRPVHYRGSGAPQAIEQAHLFGKYAPCCDLDLALKEEKTSDSASLSDLIFKGWNKKQPWHINVSLEETTENLTPEDLSSLKLQPFSPIRDKVNVASLAQFLRDIWGGLVVVVGGLEPEDREEVYHFVKDLQAPAIIDCTSGLREGLNDLVLALPEKQLKQHPPQKILRIGDVPIGRFWRDLEKDTSIEVLSLSRTGFSGLGRESQVLSANITRMLKGLGPVEPVGDMLGMLTNHAKEKIHIDELLERFPDSEPAMLKQISLYAANASHLFLGNSLPIREWNLFAQRIIPMENINANRGANGIDGQLSTWLAQSLGEQESWCIVGDLTAMYDMAALSWLEQIGQTTRVLVIINNRGGRIFEQLPQVKNLSTEIQETISNEHQISYEGLAKMWNLNYACITSADELDIEPTLGTLLLEIQPCPQQTKELWTNLKA